MHRLILTTFLLHLIASPLIAEDSTVTASNANASAIDQIPINKKACGPVSLLNAFQFGSEKWQRVYHSVPGDDDHARVKKVIRTYGVKASKHLAGTMRWDRRTGVNALDLVDMGNEMKRGRMLPKLKLRTQFRKEKETHAALVQRAHSDMKRSFKRGLPPIINIRRFARKRLGNVMIWRGVHAHFVVVKSIPKTIPKDATSFEIEYIDPWGGVTKTGSIRIPTKSFYANDQDSVGKNKLRRAPCLIADFPGSNVGMHTLKKNEPSALILASIIGAF